ncbi:MAG: hypothetical protein HZB59_08610 [Ignavibacteriales bacterium]|nr:hypothetical protein [Ignavibacteriales bacterium]
MNYKTIVKMNISIKFILLFFLFLCFYFQFGCNVYSLKRLTTTPDSVQKIDPNIPFLKAHLKDGSVALFTKWTFDEPHKQVIGHSVFFNIDREIEKEGQDSIAFERVALFETNVINPSGAAGTMSVVTAGSAIASIICLTNPKACFGSCPTFYAQDGEGLSLMAEGFSASILPSLEATDIDHLYTAKPYGQHFEIKVTNEALETHVIRSVSLLAFPRPESNRIFISPDNKFYSAENITAPKSCIGSEGERVDLIQSFDKLERFSLTDSFDLAERETLRVSFDTVPSGNLGIIMSFRQTLLTTYLFYQALAYFGNSAAAMLAKCESSDLKDYLGNTGHTLGGIEILLPDESGKLTKIGEFGETGPIATNIQMFPLPNELPPPHTLYIRMTKGMWRINHLALASIDTTAEPLRVMPSDVQRANNSELGTLKGLIEVTKPLVTFPGDEYQIVFELPRDFDRYEIFLESRGYYLEWLREEWLAEENIEKGIEMFAQPEKSMKTEALRFKKIEPTMETSFWGSKYVK